MEKQTILIVDDIAMNLDLLEQELWDDYTLVRAEDGEQALQQADLCEPDCILLDVTMPGMGGLEVVKKLRESEKHLATPYTPVILVTALSEMSDQVRGLAAGADDYITKPWESEDLHARLKVALRIGRLQKDLTRERNELKQTLSDLQSTQAQLLHSEKMAALGKLVAGVAHELNNPIGFIYANMDHFSRYVGELQAVCEYASVGPRGRFRHLTG